MKETKMNRQLGTKWFTFYTKVRPWIVCLTSLLIFVDVFQYTDVYFDYWWMFIYFIAGIAQLVLSIMVFFKSSDDYEDFVRFVKGVLFFETFNISYQQGVQQYVNTFEIGVALVITIICLVLLYFLWYRLNMKYFERRILKEAPESVNCDYNAFSRPTQTFDSDQDSYTVNATVAPKARFCRKCGNKLLEEALFCDKCGTKIITHETQGE